MAEREWVIKELECIRDYDPMIRTTHDDVFKGYAEDAIALLKAQEPMLVKHTTSTIRCPKCNKQITSRGAIHKEIKYCWKCGQAVRWE